VIKTEGSRKKTDANKHEQQAKKGEIVQQKNARRKVETFGKTPGLNDVEKASSRSPKRGRACAPALMKKKDTH